MIKIYPLTFICILFYNKKKKNNFPHSFPAINSIKNAIMYEYAPFLTKLEKIFLVSAFLSCFSWLFYYWVNFFSSFFILFWRKSPFPIFFLNRKIYSERKKKTVFCSVFRLFVWLKLRWGWYFFFCTVLHFYFSTVVEF